MGGKVRTVRARISGRVQGVGYRDWTEQRAHSFRLSGWVRNRRDGTVEAVFSGPREDVDRMIELCRQGPPPAHVIAVAVEEEATAHPAGFGVLPTV